MTAEPAEDELSLVLAAMIGGAGASGGAILFNPGDAPATLIRARNANDALLDRVLLDDDHATNSASAVPCWIVDPSGRKSALLCMAVRASTGPARLTIVLIFDRLTPDGRRSATSAFEQRAPLARVCLRLWLSEHVLAAAARSLAAALDLSGPGIILINAVGEIGFANTAARALLKAGDGLRRVRNRVVAHELADTVKLQLAIGRVVAGPEDTNALGSNRQAATLLAIARPGRAALMLSIMSPASDEAAGGAAVLYVMDPSRDMDALLRPVCEAYRLSPAEGQLACRLAGGDTISAAAARMGVKAMTARGYLKQIFLKTATHRQPELVQLMLSSVIHTHDQGEARLAPD